MKIEWNKVTWYSKLLALALFVALPFIGFYYGIRYGKIVAAIGQEPATIATSTAVSPSAGTAAAAYYNDSAEWQTDANNTTGGFSLAYPLDFDAQDNYSVSPSTDWSLYANDTPGMKYFTLTVPRAFEPQTNLVDATLTIGASGNNAAVTQCLAPDASGGPTIATSSVTINNVNFTVFTSTSAGAGNYYETTSYRTLHAGKCYAVEYTVHSGQIANYPSSYDLQPFNGQQIDSVMQNIVGTFKFM
ncbi:MAG: hypothetical protein ABR884_03635 [Minisyncoccia bacterium]